MKTPLVLAVALAAAAPALGQQPPAATPPAAAAPAAAPAFAAPNLSEEGARSLAASCAICHGTDGQRVAGTIVAGLAGRPKGELVAIMAAFRDGSRPATVMHQIAKGYGEAEIAAMAEWFSRQPAQGRTP